jgi:release factor glutamine methyltransferase
VTTVADLLATSGLPLFEARALLAHCLRVPRERLIAHPEEDVGRDEVAAFADLVRRRAAGEPLAYQLGEKEFYGRSFRVTPDVLVPRPETELLVDLALARMRGLARPRVLDLGTGSGCIAITLALECPAAIVTAVDAWPAALEVARDNARRLGATVELRAGDWYRPLPAGSVFDFIVANPPYVAADDPHLEALRFEPQQALTDGSDGLSCLKAVALGAPSHLAAGGWLLVEHGYDQATAAGALFARAGMTAEMVSDAAGLPRVTLGRTPQSPV